MGKFYNQINIIIKNIFLKGSTRRFMMRVENYSRNVHTFMSFPLIVGYFFKEFFNMLHIYRLLSNPTINDERKMSVQILCGAVQNNGLGIVISNAELHSK